MIPEPEAALTGVLAKFVGPEQAVLLVRQAAC
jgi:hypothetical protein